MAKIAVIGGGAAGMMFSTQYKKMNPGDEIFIFEKSFLNMTINYS